MRSMQQPSRVRKLLDGSVQSSSFRLCLRADPLTALEISFIHTWLQESVGKINSVLLCAISVSL